MALAPRSLMMLFLAWRSGGVTLPPGLGTVIYFGSGNSKAVFLSPPSRPRGWSSGRIPEGLGGCRGSGLSRGQGPGSVWRTGPVSKPQEGSNLAGKFYCKGRSGLYCQSVNVFRSPSFTCK